MYHLSLAGLPVKGNEGPEAGSLGAFRGMVLVSYGPSER
jgi:hypothetical protein